MPAHNECWDDGLIPTGRRVEEIDDRDLLLHRIQEPVVIRRVGVGSHKLVVDDIITRVDLAMRLALIVVPDPPALPGEHSSDGQQPGHLSGLEDPALRVHGSPGDALAAELEPAREIAGIQHAASQASEPINVAERRLE
jgi:hypothetical protein